MTIGACDTSFPHSSDGTNNWTANGNICDLQSSLWQTLLLNISLQTNRTLQKAWCNRQQHLQTGSSFLLWVNDIIFLFRNISPAGSHRFHCLPKCNQLFVQVPGCLSAPQVLPFLQEWPHPVPAPPLHLPQKEILWTSAAHSSWGSGCVCYYPICTTILQLQVVPEDTNQSRGHNTPWLNVNGVCFTQQSCNKANFTLTRDQPRPILKCFIRLRHDIIFSQHQMAD